MQTMGNKMENTTFKAYLLLLREITKKIEQLNELAQKKIEAVHTDNVQAVDECIRQEQVISLSLRGLEIQRTKALTALGLEKVPLSGLLQHAPEGLRQETAEVTSALRNTYEVYRSASSAARSALERVLHQIDRMLAAEKAAAPKPAPGPRRQAAVQEPPVGGHGADFKA